MSSRFHQASVEYDLRGFGSSVDAPRSPSSLPGLNAQQFSSSRLPKI
ncbi:MAG: hypothetical protein HC827_06370 [Cyanobacteria bacterium RM1_2_2]|nr:hypothetical protein [Cyanobacteria bacterium RM1_2_2]